MDQDLHFSGEQWAFDVRTTGVLVRDGKILVQREKDGHEYALPGGHIKIGETLEDGLIREWKEEMGADIRVGKMLWSEECFWEWRGKTAHNLSFYFQVEPMTPEALPADGVLFSQKDNCNVVLEWMRLEELQQVVIYPSFIKEEISRLDGPVRHFVTRA